MFIDIIVILDTKTELTAHNTTNKMHCTINMYALKTYKYLRYRAKINTIKTIHIELKCKKKNI